MEHHHIRKEMVGDYEMLANFSFGGLPYELGYEQLSLPRVRLRDSLRRRCGTRAELGLQTGVLGDHHHPR